MRTPPAGILVSTHHVLVTKLTTSVLLQSFVVLTRKQRCVFPKAGALSLVFHFVEGAASGAVLLRRDRRALWLSAAVFTQRRETVWISNTEGGHAQAIAVTILHQQDRLSTVAFILPFVICDYVRVPRINIYYKSKYWEKLLFFSNNFSNFKTLLAFNFINGVI